MSSAERDKVILILAQILMQAAGLNVEELCEPFHVAQNGRN
jgi:hypothetical protein